MNDFCIYIETTYCLNNKKITTVDCMIPSPMYLLPKHVREKAINMYKSVVECESQSAQELRFKEFELMVYPHYLYKQILRITIFSIIN